LQKSDYLAVELAIFCVMEALAHGKGWDMFWQWIHCPLQRAFCQSLVIIAHCTQIPVAKPAIRVGSLATSRNYSNNLSEEINYSSLIFNKSTNFTHSLLRNLF